MNDHGDLIWHKSPKSSGGACVELAVAGEHVYMRNSKDPSGAVLAFDRDAFGDFFDQIKQTGIIAE